MMAPGEHPEFGKSVHMERALELDVEGEEDEAALGVFHDDDEEEDDELQVDSDDEGRRRRPSPSHHAGWRSVHKQDATIQMVKWTRAAITTRKKVLKEVDENEPTGLDWFEEDYLKNLLTIQEFERKFVVLAHHWRRFMNFYGLLEDVSLLLVDAKVGQVEAREPGATRKVNSRLERKPGRVNFMTVNNNNNNNNSGPKYKEWLEAVRKLLWLLMIAGANLATIYMLIAHFAWELHRLDATISTAVASVNDSQQAAAAAGADQTGQGGGPKQVVAVVVVAGNPQLATFNGWSILRDFLENLRRHLSRFFALVLIFIWHKNCHKFERLFVDSRSYYAAFYPKLSSLGMSELWTTHGPTAAAAADHHGETTVAESGGADDKKSQERAEGARKIRVILTIREHQLQLIEAASRFYKLASRRIAFAVWLPFAHLVFNIVGILLAPNALIVANNGQPAAASSAAASSAANTTTSVADRLLANFETFHMAVHTAFHPYEHQISPEQPPISPGRSALYCLAELFVLYIYISGPRIVCATCLSLVLSIHHQCLRAFNKHLTKLIRRGRESPLSRWDMVKLLKQYDMIGMMHERIEATFKWSLVSWFTLMFISCLMLIFTLTESTSAAFSGPATPTPTSAPSLTAASAPDILETICPVAIMLVRIFFACYAPILIYVESFKIESESARATQLIMLLARRQDDPVAQAIEPGLFGPIQLSAGGFFQLSKRSVAPLLGAIVTFSIMFIGSDEELASAQRSWPPSTSAQLWPDDARREETENSAAEEEREHEFGREAESPDDAAVGPSAGLQRRTDGSAQHRRHRVTADRETAAATTRLMGGQRKPFGHAKISLSSPAAGAGGGGADEPKARQWRKHKRLNRKIELSQSQGQQRDAINGHPDAYLDTSRAHAGLKRTTSSTTGNQVERDPPGSRQANGLTDGDQGHLTRAMRPRLAAFYLARLRENERQLSFAPRLKVENQIEICDFELLGARGPGQTDATKISAGARSPESPAGGLFAVTWIDRMSGEIAIEATNLTLINCERQRNYTLGMRAIACNGLESNEATLRIELEDVNEFSPEFERSQYSVSVDALELKAKRQFVAADDGDDSEDDTEDEQVGQQSDQATSWCHLLTVRAHDQDCSRELGQVCRYELVGGAPDTPRHPDTSDAGGPQQSGASGVNSQVRVDAQGNLKAKCKWLLGQADAATTATSSFLFQVVAFDCGGKKSQRPARVLLDIRGHHHNPHGLKRETVNEPGAADQAPPCRPGWKDVDTHIAYKPASGEHWPFLRAKLDLCSIKCHRPLNMTVGLQLEATPPPSPNELASGGGDGNIKTGSIRRARHNPTPVFHCDRDPYAMVSKRRLCGARRKTLELLPPLSAHTRWIGPLLWKPTTAGRGPRRHQRRPKVTDKVHPVAPVQGNSTEASAGDDAANSASSLQADELPLKPDDDDEDDEGDEGDDDDLEEAPKQTEEEVDASTVPMRSIPADDEENLGAYLPDGSYGQLAREFAAHEHQQSEVGGGRARSADLPGKSTPPPRTDGNSDDRKQQRRQMRASERAESPRFRRSAIYRDQVYHFDGANDALLVPSYVYGGSGGQQQQLDSLASTNNRTNGILFGLKHTLSFWMRHGEFEFKQQRRRRRRGGRANESELPQQDELLELSRHVREHLLCVSERRHSPSHDHQLPASNHLRQHHPKHYAIYMRSCKLILLMRRPAQRGDENEADQGDREPHEWRWSLDQTGQFCDNKWHLYTINVNYPQVELYVDGQQFDTEKKVFAPAASGSPPTEATSGDDASASSTVLTLGACWDARSRSMVGHFRGALSGLNVLSGANDEAGSIECLGRCTESLVSSAPQRDQQRAPPPPVHSQQQDNSLVAYQEAQDRIQLRGHDPLDLEDALAQLAYVNRRQLPSIGRRTINVQTNLSCHLASGGAVLEIPVELLKIDVNVLPSTSLPVISLAGTPNLAREHLPFIQGQVAPFESIKLWVKQVSLLDTGKPRPGGSLPERQRQVSGRMTLKSNQFTADLLDYIDDATLNLHHHNQPTPGGATAAVRINLEASENLANSGGRIESCHIEASPPLDETHETLLLPLAQLRRLDLYWRQSSSGAVIYGLDSVQNYESLLRMILYRNERPGAYEERHFRLACSDMSGRLLSNEHHQRLTVIHARPAAGGEDAPLDDSSSSSAPPLVATNETNYFSALRHSAGPHLTLDSEQVVTNKLDRVAMAFLVFVVSLILIVLVIALANLRDTTGGSATKRRNKMAAGGHPPRLTGNHCAMLERQNLVGRRHQCTNTLGSYTDTGELVNTTRADCYFAHDELIEHEDSYTSAEELEYDEQIEQGGPGKFDEDDAMIEYDWQEQMYDLSVRSTNSKISHAPFAAPMSPPLSSLSWDDELNCGRHRRNHSKCPAATTIVINPLSHPDTGEANAPVARRTLVASLEQGRASQLGAHPQSHLAIEPPVETSEHNERASSISGREGDASDSEGSIRTMDALSLEGDDNDLLALDEDMASSLCFHSRSCSLTSLASQGTEMTAGEEPGDTDQECGPARYQPDHAHFRHTSPPRRRACPHSAAARHRPTCAHHGSEERALARPAAYEICHQHHHACLRETARHRAECSSATTDSDTEIASSDRAGVWAVLRGHDSEKV